MDRLNDRSFLFADETSHLIRHKDKNDLVNETTYSLLKVLE